MKAIKPFHTAYKVICLRTEKYRQEGFFFFLGVCLILFSLAGFLYYFQGSLVSDKAYKKHII